MESAFAPQENPRDSLFEEFALGDSFHAHNRNCGSIKGTSAVCRPGNNQAAVDESFRDNLPRAISSSWFFNKLEQSHAGMTSSRPTTSPFVSLASYESD
jgi:hypothetical protein